MRKLRPKVEQAVYGCESLIEAPPLNLPMPLGLQALPQMLERWSRRLSKLDLSKRLKCKKKLANLSLCFSEGVQAIASPLLRPKKRLMMIGKSEGGRLEGRVHAASPSERALDKG